jgi:hypothetical protein
MRDKQTLEAVARLLGLMTATPNLRDQPQPGDRPGAFTHWFDGGAITVVNDYALYEFVDGARALLPAPFRQVFLQLPDGTHLSLSWEKVDLPAKSSALSVRAQVRCPRCQHDNAPDSRFCSECGAALTLPTVAPILPEPVSGMGVASIPPVVAQPAPAPVMAAPAAALETIPPTPAAAKQCPHCLAPNKPTARFCLTCGKPIPAAVTGPIAQGKSSPPSAPGTAEKICASCQFANTSTAHHCQRCGALLA